MYVQQKVTIATVSVLQVRDWVNFIDDSVFGEEKYSDDCLE